MPAWRPRRLYDDAVSSPSYDLAVIGGGIVGLATARALLRRSRVSVVLLEAEDRLASHQSGHNSGVIHSGLYYPPGSLKARNCTAGRDALYRFCDENGVAHERCGKIVVATSQAEVERLAALEERGRANGLAGLKRLAADELSEYEPHVAGVAGLHVPETGIVDYKQVTRVMADQIRGRDGTIRTGARVLGIRRDSHRFALETMSGDVRCRYIIGCAGLQSDRIARLAGLRPRVRIIPFLGEYSELNDSRRSLVRNLIYPVPDPRFPFLGVHFTRMIDGGVEAGPNAVLALKREGYTRWAFSVRDTLDSLTYVGFYRMGLRYWKAAAGEYFRSLSRRAFVKSLQKLIPELEQDDFRPATPGIRAQAVAPDGRLLDDFAIEQAEGMLHVLNAPSPAATAALSIGKTLASMASESFSLPGRRATPQ